MPALYYVDVTVPYDAPPGNFLKQCAQVRIVTDHPHAPVIPLEVAFVVIGDAW
jgi:hypothetical protein